MSDSEGKASPVVHAYLPRAGVDPRFFAYLLRDLAQRGFVASLARGIRERSTSFDSETLRSLVVPNPPFAVQRAIADHVDSETARLDALIAKKRQLVAALLRRHRIAVERCVLGLDEASHGPASSFFDSCPNGWGETALRHLRCEVQTGPFGSQLHAAEYIAGGWPVVNPANLTGGSIKAIPTMAVSDAKREELARHVLKAGDLVFGRRGEMGRVGLVTKAEVGWLCGTGSLRLRVKDDRLDPAYLKLALETTAIRRYLDLNSVGSTMDNLNSEIVLGLPLLLPPLPRQRYIVEKVTLVSRGHAAIADRLRSQIDLLVEHRQALVTAAVTGELRIPGVAA